MIPWSNVGGAHSTQADSAPRIRLGTEVAKAYFPTSASFFLSEAVVNEPLQATCWALLHVFQLQLQSYALTFYHLDGAALARCAAAHGPDNRLRRLALRGCPLPSHAGNWQGYARSYRRRRDSA